jgi:hypothetical protein
MALFEDPKGGFLLIQRGFYFQSKGVFIYCSDDLVDPKRFFIEGLSD